jgi:hypothetical protein
VALRSGVLASVVLFSESAWAGRLDLGDDDPKLARARPQGGRVLADEDDPKLARGAPPARRRGWPRLDHPVPRFKLGYRYLQLASLDGGTVPAHAASLDFYPLSNLIRFGLSTEAGFTSDTYGTWYLAEGASLGLQWPARVTPFLEGRFLAGLIAGTVLGHAAVSYLYGGGVEAGIEVYYAKRFYVTIALGWVHPVYAGVDIAALMANPTSNPPRKDFASDSFTLKVGLGL